MNGGILIAIMIVSAALGMYFNQAYNNEYGLSAIQIGPCAFQCIALLIMLANWPNSDIKTWFVIGIFLTIISYVVAFVACKKQADEIGATEEFTIKAIAAQFLLPIGIVIFIFVILALALGNKKNKRR